MYAVYPKGENTDDDLLFLHRVLNSSLANYVISKISSELTEGAFTIFRTNQPGRPPVIFTNEICRNSIVSFVNQIITLKTNNQIADTNALESAIDQLVYELYGLTEEEIKIVENS